LPRTASESRSWTPLIINQGSPSLTPGEKGYEKKGKAIKKEIKQEIKQEVKSESASTAKSINKRPQAEPYKGQTPSKISFDSTAYERYADQLRPPPASPTPDPAPAPGAVEPVTASYKRGASDVTTRSEREAEHEQERPTRRAVGAQKLAGLSIKAAQEGREGTEGGEGTQGRPHRIRVLSRTAPGDVRESWA
jgi:hypothetical protein